MGLDRKVRAEESNKTQMENIWLLFDKRLSMLSVLAKHIMPDHFSDDDITKIENLFTDGSGLVDVKSAPDKPLTEAIIAQSTKDGDNDEVAPKADDAPVMPTLRGEKPQKDSQASSTKSSPMDFFAGDDDKDMGDDQNTNDDDGDEIPDATDDSGNKEEDRSDEEGGSDKGKSSGGKSDPMSFFKD